MADRTAPTERLHGALRLRRIISVHALGEALHSSHATLGCMRQRFDTDAA
jgi:hypothetical protein